MRAEPVIRSARARGGCRAHAGRVRPAACSFRISVRSAWSLHHSDTPELSLGNAICNRAEVEGMCELLHTGDVFWPSSGDPPPRGTDGSNPFPSSGESCKPSVPWRLVCCRSACQGATPQPQIWLVFGRLYSGKAWIQTRGYRNSWAVSR